MRAGLRLGIAVLAAGMVPAGAPALAQDAPPAAMTNTPAADAIGPRELQGFSLEGRVTRPAEPAATPRTQARAPSRAPEAREPVASPTRSAEAESRSTSESTDSLAPTRTAEAAPTRAQRTQTPASSSVTVQLPPPSGVSAIPAAAPGFAPDSSGDDASLAPDSGPPLWLWLLAAMALGGGAAFLLRRNRMRESYAGGPQVDAFVAPEPAPRPAPRAAPPATPAPAPLGVVSTRLRPWIDIRFQPLQCMIQDEQVIFEFEIELLNTGSAPARDVLIEASIFNASPDQDRDLSGFYEKPLGQGERIPVIQPLKHFSVRTQFAAPRANLRVLEAAGRKVFVPLIAFNALYRWSAGEGQTSVSYLLGRKSRGEKMAPFRLDLGSRAFAGLDSRELPLRVRK